MKYLYILFILLSACTVDPIIEPICPHTVEREGQKAKITVVSDLNHVEICHTIGQKQRCLGVESVYYECISISIPEETEITIKAEETCEFKL